MATSAGRARTALSAFAVIWCAAGALTLITAYECSSIFHPSSLYYAVVLWGWWGFVACALWKIGEHKPFLSGFSARSILLHAGAAAVLGYAHLVGLWSLGFMGLGWYAGFDKWKAFHALLCINRFGIEVLVYGFVFGLIGIVQYQLHAQRERIRSLELERQLSAAQLRALQMQLEPHFLFNTLNAITTLVELGRQEEAVEMLAHLNTILKSTLKRTTPEKVPLWQEMEIVENYLAIEQVRFADRLRIEIKVEPSALDSLVPCFLLQPIVENAIRHGIAHCESDGIVEASARRDGNLLRLEVRNNGLRGGTPSRPGNGIGLKNTRERLIHFYRDAFDMQAAPLDAGGFQVAIAIPYERR
ncbi:sensor histidine kinase [Terracidiphilus gabretensis]|uniref:sensor histidine kinase n=1 Tax=Terracidiphilus gabretensis TaxID=1577687 RepID=UPI0018D2357A|nr:histidine kinase [Terracidiphilus gabretensis]